MTAAEDPGADASGSQWTREVHERSALQVLVNESYRLYRRAARRAEGERSSAQYRILGALAYLGETRLSDLAAYEQISQAGVAKVFVVLEAEGLVERRPDPSDGRAQLARITDAGIADFRAFLGRLDDVLPALSARENAILRRATEIVRRAD
ncbi:MarR family winged helix-turn-helix transcriptional regulator [Microbacterium sp. No. 7]|uniref:MarR family winged helix-turn-helix transcriptional regulator n=1 Tax=Microbacterium sp. No. 7 TaxID=1714373 RepID=UPI0006D046DA|nr:MarR family transcriptional regulator [Microbacterium sp. No. 7]ALJ18874.1 hypothetical protein AOA12_02685 [Microbacterium sp. No. 7]